MKLPLYVHYIRFVQYKYMHKFCMDLKYNGTNIHTYGVHTYTITHFPLPPPLFCSNNVVQAPYGPYSAASPIGLRLSASTIIPFSHHFIIIIIII